MRNNQFLGNPLGSWLKGKSFGRLVAHDFQCERVLVELFGEPSDLPDLLHALTVDLQQEVTGLQSSASGGGALRHLDVAL